MGSMSPSTSRPPADTHPQRILIILGHPSASSLCAGLADAYAQGARDSGAEVRLLRLGELDFDPLLHAGYRQDQPLEPDLQRARSEEHTSELQSPCNLVCRLLLEKKTGPEDVGLGALQVRLHGLVLEPDLQRARS